MKYIVKINETEYEVVVEKGAANIINTTLVVAAAPAGTAAAVPAAIPAIAPQAAASAAAVSSAPPAGAAGYIVKSPMPGTILDIRVQSGASIKRGDILLILEAMKMENEIVAPKDGVIGQIFITKGASVVTNDNLISIL